MTSTLAQQIFAVQLAQEQAIFAYAELLRTQSQQMTDPENLDIESGWPETYK